MREPRRGEERLEVAWNGAVQQSSPEQPFLEVALVADGHATQQVGMTADVLGGRGDRHIGTPFQRALVERGCHGVVDSQDRSGLARCTTDGRDVGNSEKRVRR